ncbi:MAG: winged helix-turn-helix domain-containing protein [Candidatus Hodarchaeota archaeon]
MSSEISQDLRVEIVSDPDRIKALIDENRLGILRALREGISEENNTIRYEMTVPEIAQRLGKKAPNLYHHADVLVEHGFLEVARQEQKKRSFITYYRRTKPVFIIASEPESELPYNVIYDKPLVAALASSLDLSNQAEEELKKLMHEYRLRRSKAAMFFTQHFEKRSRKPIAQEHVFEAINIMPYFLLFLDNEMPAIARRIIDLLGIEKI